MSTNLYVDIGFGQKFTVDDLDIACNALNNSVARMACDEIDEHEQCYVLSWLDYGVGDRPSTATIAENFSRRIEAETAETQKLKIVRYVPCSGVNAIRQCIIVTFRPTSCY